MDLQALLIRHEGLKLFPYQDTTGHMTIGCGRCLDTDGISEQEALMLLSNDIAKCQRLASSLPWFFDLNEVRRNVITCMIFNLGFVGFLGFKQMILAIQRQDFDRAATEMLNSRWASQVKNRAVELANYMRSGVYFS